MTKKTYSFWDMSYSDELRVAIFRDLKGSQRKFFLDAYNRFGDYIRETDESLTFGEWFDCYGRP